VSAFNVQVQECQHLGTGTGVSAFKVQVQECQHLRYRYKSVSI
jgi:hypothetical protein